MAIPRPKMLPAIVIPDGGWDMVILCEPNDGGGTDTVTATLAAGTYFMSGDNQADDLMNQLQIVVDAAVKLVPFNASNGTETFSADIHPTTHKVRFYFGGAAFADATQRDVTLDWPNSNADLAKVLGFDNSVIDQKTTENNPTFTGDWHHGQGWYSDRDGNLEEHFVSNHFEAIVLQSVSISGRIKTQLIGKNATNSLTLRYLPNNKTWCGAVDYGTAPAVVENLRNEALEYWWREAIQGTRFRVYRNGYIVQGRANDWGERSGANAATLTDATKTWAIDPQRFAGRVLHQDTYGGITQNWYIVSHTATVLTVTTGHPLGVHGSADTGYSIYDHPYDTYVLDVLKSREFDPREIVGLNEYDWDINLRKYVA